MCLKRINIFEERELIAKMEEAYRELQDEAKDWTQSEDQYYRLYDKSFVKKNFWLKDAILKLRSKK